MKNRKRFVSILAGILAGILILSLFIGVLPQAGAASSSELKKQLDELKEQKEELAAQIKELESQRKDNLNEMEAIVEEKSIIDQEVFLLHDQLINMNEQLSTFSLLIADKQEELDEAEARLEQLNEQNKERIRAMEEDGSLSYWAVLFKANSFTDLLDRLDMIEEIAAADQRRIKEMKQAAQEVEAAREELVAEKAELEAAKEELALAQEELDAKREVAEELLLQLIARGEEYEALIDESEDAQSELMQEIAKTEKDYKNQKYKEWLATSVPPTTKPKPTAGSSSSGSSGSSSSGSTSVPSSSGWRYPLPNRVGVSSPYGWRIHPVYHTRKFHHGIDLNASKGTAILAAKGGTVTMARYESAAGYYVTINHGDGFSSSYMHMTHFVVKKGDIVQAGQVIGYVGSTGVSTGAHLHFAIYFNGNSVNPANYVNF